MTNPRDIVLLERREGGVRVITLNHPGRRNAIRPEMQAELVQRIREIASSPEARRSANR